MDKKKSILIYSDFLHKISKLSDEQAGKLFKGLLNYSNGITPEFDDVLLDYAFEDIKTTIDRDTEKYSLKCLKNKEIALERERIKRERNSTNVNERTQVITNSTDKDIDIDIDKDIDKDIDSDILLEKETKEEINFFENLSNWEDVELVKPEKEEERKKVAPKKERSEEQLKMPDDFIEIWEEWKEYRKAKQFKSYAGLKWEQMAVDKLLELSNKNPTIAKLILKQTYENSYQGFFPLKQNSNGITNTTQSRFSNNGAVSNGKVSGRSIVADRISQHLARNSESGNHTIDIEANIVR